MPDIAFHGLVPDFIEPEYQTEEAACFDIYLLSDLYLAPGEPVDLPLGFSADIEKGYSVQIYPRSSAGRNWECSSGTASASLPPTSTASGARSWRAGFRFSSAAATGFCRGWLHGASALMA